MNPPEDHRTQMIALFLIVFASLCLGFGEWKTWIHLVDFANMFGGGGVGILTGQKLQQLTNKGDATLNIESPK
jgi:hypothetical protein